MRQVYFLSLALLWALSPLFSQGNFDGCDPDVLLAVDDHYIIQEDDLPSFTENLLNNDVINMDAWYPWKDCLRVLGLSKGRGSSSTRAAQTAAIAAAAPLTFVYTLLIPERTCFARPT